jgi:hypothetical protein
MLAAEALLQHMRARGMQPTTATYCPLIRAYGRAQVC